jgi:hypothetical protein
MWGAPQNQPLGQKIFKLELIKKKQWLQAFYVANGLKITSINKEVTADLIQ